MTGLMIKLFTCPLMILVAHRFLPNVEYPAIYQTILVGFVLAAGAHLMEIFILRRGTLWISTIADFFVATLIVYYSQYFIQGAFITWTGAALTALLISLGEVVVHLFLIRTGQTKKT